MADWWDEYPDAAPRGAPSGMPPPTLYGDPVKPPPVNPLDEEAKRLEIIRKRQVIANGELTEGQAKLKESESQAAFLATNLVGNANIISKALKVDPKAAAPTWGQVAAGLLGEDVRNQFTPDQRAVVYNAQKLVVDAALTLGTGAAYTPVQIEAYTRGFFPQVGDTPEKIAAKKESLRIALVAARTKAGGAAPEIDKAMKALGLSSDPLGGDVTGPSGRQDAPPKLSEEDVQAQLRNRISRGDKAADTIQWLVSIGRPPDDDIIQRIIANEGNRHPDVRIVDAPADGGASPFAVSVGGIAEAAGDTVGLLGNPFNAAVNSIAGTNLSTDLGRTFREQLGLPEAENNSQRTINAVGEGALSMLAIGGLARGAMKGVSPQIQSALDSFIKRPVADMVAGGASTGSGEIARQQGAGVWGQLGAAALGGGVGALAPFARRSAPGIAPNIANAMSDLQVRMPAKLMAGGKRAINKAAIMEADDTTAPIIQQGFEQAGSDIEAAVGRKLSRGGDAVGREKMGETFREVGKRIIAEDREGHTATYRAAEELQPGVVADPMDMRAKVDARLEKLRIRPNQNNDQIRALQTYRKDLEKPLPLQEIRDMRTDARDNIVGGITNRTPGQKRADRFMVEVIDSAKSDIERALNPEALAAWQAADKQFAQNQTLYRESLKPIFGDDFDKLPAEAIYDRVKAAANSNGRALAGLHRRLTPEQSRNFAATIAEGMGRAGPDEEFSVSLFLRQARRFSPSARETIFGPSGADSMNNLLVLGRKLKSLQAQINTSRTARPLGSLIKQQAGNLMTVLMGGGGYAAGGPMGGAGGVALGMGVKAAGNAVSGVMQPLSARALMNPRVTNWMKRSVDVRTPEDAKAAVQRLGIVIAREPSLAAELQPLNDFLNQRLATPLAAETEGQNDD